MERIILHCDLNNFYASVECKETMGLVGHAVAVAGDPNKRHGVVLAKNDIAKAAGVKTGDVIWEAKIKCPDIIFVPPHFDLYDKYSRAAFSIYNRFTPYVEPFGADECWLDVSGSTSLFGGGVAVADTIRGLIRTELGLTASVGVSFNKIFAKLGSDLKKPDATTLISRENFKELIYQLNASEIMGVGKKTAEKLRQLNINTIGDLASAPQLLLKQHLGKVGIDLNNIALGLDNSPVKEAVKQREVKSVGHGMTATRDIVSKNAAQTVISYLAGLISNRMRKKALRGRGCAIDIRYADLTHSSRQTSLTYYIFAKSEINTAAFKLFCEIWTGEAVRTITVSIFNLSGSGAQQLSMFDAAHDKAERLDNALDKIRNKYGKDKIVTADMMGNDFIYDKTDSEDFLPFKR